LGGVLVGDLGGDFGGEIWGDARVIPGGCLKSN
jgi:hypothetical protein